MALTNPVQFIQQTRAEIAKEIRKARGKGKGNGKGDKDKESS